uniref:Uncharacterized protein n=1 Tax=Arundo donax TaxID=35708 RepID=A0A0A8Y4G2_ARUDO
MTVHLVSWLGNTQFPITGSATVCWFSDLFSYSFYIKLINVCTTGTVRYFFGLKSLLLHNLRL